MQNVHSKKYQEEFSTKILIKNNQRRKLHKQRIRKPGLDDIVISSMAKNDFLRAFFSLLMLFVGCDFADTPNFCCFFSGAHTKKNNRHLVCPRKRVKQKTGGREKRKQKEAKFLQCLCSRTRQAMVFFLVNALNFYGYVLRYL